jgi:ankyrin repeat protein
MKRAHETDGATALKRARSNIDALPPEILAWIAQFLARDRRARGAFARVSRRFRRLAFTTFDPTPTFRHACDRGYVHVVRLLLADPRVDPAARGNHAILRSSKNGRADVVRLLLADGRADPAAHYNYAIHLSSKNGHTEVVRLLLADGRADPSADNNIAICESSARGHADVVRLLLGDARVDPTAHNNYAIRAAIERNHAHIVRLLLADRRQLRQFGLSRDAACFS